MKFFKSYLYSHFTNLLLTGIINVGVCLRVEFREEGERTPHSILIITD